MQPLKTIKPFELAWRLKKKALKFMNVIGPFTKKLENLLFSKRVVIGQSSKCPGSSSRTVRQDNFCCGVKYIV